MTRALPRRRFNKTVKAYIFSLDADNTEKALLAAIASIETESMAVDYPEGDGKRGASYNVGIYKANVHQLKKIDKNINIQRFHNDYKYATDVMLRGIRKFGQSDFLAEHRGGESIRGEAVNSYICAIKVIAMQYMIKGLEINQVRYTVNVDAI